MREFQDSTEFRKFTQIAIDRIQDDEAIKNELEKLLKFRGKALDIEGVIALIIKIRGDLHHYVNNPNRVEGTPFNHRSFKLISYLTRDIAGQAIIQKMRDANKKD